MASEQDKRYSKDRKNLILKIMLSGWMTQTEISETYLDLVRESDIKTAKDSHAEYRNIHHKKITDNRKKKKVEIAGTVRKWFSEWEPYRRMKKERVYYTGVQGDENKDTSKPVDAWRLDASYFLHRYKSKKQTQNDKDLFTILTYLFNEEYIQVYLSKKENPEETFKTLLISLYLTKPDTKLYTYFRSGLFHIPVISKFILEETSELEKLPTLLKLYRSYILEVCHTNSIAILQRNFSFLEEIEQITSFHKDVPKKYLKKYLKEHQTDKGLHKKVRESILKKKNIKKKRE
jgi:hypothetical protein